MQQEKTLQVVHGQSGKSGVFHWFISLVLALTLINTLLTIPALSKAHSDSYTQPSGVSRGLSSPNQAKNVVSVSTFSSRSTNGETMGSCTLLNKRLFLPMTTRSGPGNPPVTFSISLPPCQMTLQGYGGNLQVKVEAQNGFTGQIDLSLVGAPQEITASLNPSSVNSSGVITLTLGVSESTPAGTYNLTVKGVSGSLVRTVPLTLVVVEPLMIEGKVEYDSGGGVEGAQVSLSTKDKLTTTSAASGVNGEYSAKLPVLRTPAKILAQAVFTPPGLPTLNNARWQVFETHGNVQMEPILLPDPAGAEIPLVGGAGETGDGSLKVEGLSAEVQRLFGKTYDPGVSPEAFPGEFAEQGQVPLNSSLFLWMAGLTTQGKQVHNLAQPASVRARIPSSQWADLEDIRSGTEGIEIPIYTFNEQTQMW